MKEVLNIANKIEKNEQLTEFDKRILVEAIKEQKKCIDYYSQNFVGTWDCDEVSVNWRAKECQEHIKDKIKEITEENIIDVETNGK